MPFRWKIFRDSLTAWWIHNPPRLGAALAYYTLLSLAPLLLIFVAIAGSLFGEDAVRGQIFWQIRNVAGDQSAALVQTLLKNAAHHPTSGIVASTVGFAMLLVGASGIFSELRDDLNLIWEIHDEGGSTWLAALRQRAISLGLMLGAGFLVVLSLTVSIAIQTASRLAPGWMTHSASLLEALTTAVTFVFSGFVFALMYRFFPSTSVAWKDVVVGALVTAALFALGKSALAIYLAGAGVGSAYGAAGSVVLFLVWVYYSSQIFLFGAEFTHIYALHRGSLQEFRQLQTPDSPSRSSPAGDISPERSRAGGA